MYIFHFRICEIVSQYYQKKFLEGWRINTDSKTINVLAALLVEKHGQINVVVLAAGNTKKGECSYSSSNGSTDEYTWGLCDGHAESVCYRLANLYLITEMQRYNNNSETSILKITGGRYLLKEGVKFHFFTTQLPCGFMAKEARDFLSWKIPFKGKPHCLQCSSTILISAYLGIQGPLSHLFSEPIYVSSITIPKHNNVTAENGIYIKTCFEDFKARLDEIYKNTDCGYTLVIPQVRIADIQPEKLFPECFIQWPFGDGSCSEVFRLESVERQESKNAAVSVPHSVSISEPPVLVFTLKSGIGRKEFRMKMASQLKNATNEVIRQSGPEVIKKLKVEKLKLLKEAQVRLCNALNVGKALENLKSSIIEKMGRRFTTHCPNCDKINDRLKEIEQCKIITSELTVQVNKLEDSFHAIMKQVKNDHNIQGAIASLTSLSESTKKFKTDSKSMTNEFDKSLNKFEEGTKSVLSELTDYYDLKQTFDDLSSLLEANKANGRHSQVYLDLMGCDWARYLESMHDDIENSS